MTFQPTLVALAAALAFAGSAGAQNIGTLQGESHPSPFANQDVTGIRGIVTAVDANGFWFQDGGDGNALTSDALYVFRDIGGTKPLVGSDVSVRGRLQEFRPGNTPTNLTTTQINATSGFSGGFTVLSTGNALPAAVTIGAGLLPPIAIAPNVGNVETAPGYKLAPSLYAMDFYESMEGMRVTLPSAVASGPRNSFGEIALVASAQLTQPGVIASPRGGVVVGPGQFNGQRIIVDDRIVVTPPVNSGARFSNVVGVLGYSSGNYKLYATQPPLVVADPLAREVASVAAGRFTLASYNVDNLGGNASAARFDAIATQIATNLGAPHLVSLQEIQDNNGATNDGTVAADVTLGTLAAALNGKTGRNYQFITVNPVDNADGVGPGVNVRQAFLYDSARVSFSGVVGGALDAVTATGVGGRIQLSLGAGRVDPTNPAWTDGRKPLVSEFTVDGEQIIVVANHFDSKSGDQPLFGPAQAPARFSEVRRLAQAQALGSFVQGLLAINPNANIVLTGGFNDFQFADTLAPLTAAGLVNLSTLLPEGERYSFASEGNLQQLDHMFVSRNLLGKADLAFDIVHANAEFLNQVSDHDPLLLSFGSIPAPVPEPATVAMVLAGLGLLAAAKRRRR